MLFLPKDIRLSLAAGYGTLVSVRRGKWKRLYLAQQLAGIAAGMGCRIL